MSIPAAIGHLSGIVARSAAPPLLVTFSRAPVPGLMAQAFGPDTAFNLVVADQSGPLRFARAFTQSDPATPPSEIALAAAETRIFGPPAPATDPPRPGLSGPPIIARFVEPNTLTRMEAARPGFLRGCAAIVVQIAAQRPREAALELVRGLGFTAVAHFDIRDGMVICVATAQALPDLEATAPAATWPIHRLVIIDPCLDGRRGHYLPLARAFTAGAEALGADIVWACHRDFTGKGVPPGVTVRPCFPRSFFDIPPEALATTDLGPEMAPVIADLLAAFREPGTHFLAHSADPALLRAILILTEGGVDLPAPVHLSLPNHPWRMPGRAAGIEASRALVRLTASGAWNRTLFMWTETRTLSAQIGLRLGQTIPALPLPVPCWAAAAPAAPPPPDAGDALRIAYVGEARVEKGFLDLPELAAAVARLPGVTLAIHVLPPPHGFTTDHDAVLDNLAASPVTELHAAPLDEAGYRAFIAAAHAVLLPYNPAHYAGRGSGILCDAIVSGRAVIARHGPTMAEHAAEGVVLTYADPDGFAAAVMRLRAERGALMDRARADGARFRGQRHAAAVVAALSHRVAWSRAGG